MILEKMNPAAPGSDREVRDADRFCGPISPNHKSVLLHLQAATIAARYGIAATRAALIAELYFGGAR